MRLSNRTVVNTTTLMRMSFAEHIRRLVKEASYEHGPVRILKRNYVVCDPPIIVHVARKRPKETYTGTGVSTVICPFCKGTEVEIPVVADGDRYRQSSPARCLQCGAMQDGDGVWMDVRGISNESC